MQYPGPIDCSVLLTDTHVLGSWISPMPDHRYLSGIHQLPLVQVVTFCGYLPFVIHPFAQHCSQMKVDSRSVTQCSAVGVWFCFYQLLDEGPRIVYKVVIVLIIREVH